MFYLTPPLFEPPIRRDYVLLYCSRAEQAICINLICGRSLCVIMLNQKRSFELYVVEIFDEYTHRSKKIIIYLIDLTAIFDGSENICTYATLLIRRNQGLKADFAS